MLLGTFITSDLKWDKNTNFLVKEANKRMRLLHAASKFVKDKKILTQLYYTNIRCRLEQSAVLRHSSLTKKKIKMINRCDWDCNLYTTRVQTVFKCSRMRTNTSHKISELTVFKLFKTVCKLSANQLQTVCKTMFEVVCEIVCKTVCKTVCKLCSNCV